MSRSPIRSGAGSLLAFYHELDEWLNPDLFHTASESVPIDPLQLVAKLERQDPRLTVVYLPLRTEPTTVGSFALRRDGMPLRASYLNLVSTRCLLILRQDRYWVNGYGAHVVWSVNICFPFSTLFTIPYIYPETGEFG